MPRLPLLVQMMLALLVVRVSTGQDLRAFRTAEGFGAYSRGGRGGVPIGDPQYRTPQVLIVKHRFDDVPGGPEWEGSLRKAIETPGPRFVVFDASQVVTLNRELKVTEPYLYLAGQTSPGGYCVKGHTFTIAAHDVTVRHMRFRLGRAEADTCDERDSLLIEADGPLRNVIVANCSISWGTDDNLDIVGSGQFCNDSVSATVQDCIISEGIGTRHNGPKGCEEDKHHQCAMAIGHIKYAEVTLFRNLFAHNDHRTPEITAAGHALVDMRSNVIFNWGGSDAPSRLYHSNLIQMNYIGNVLVPGPDTDKRRERYIDDGVVKSLNTYKAIKVDMDSMHGPVGVHIAETYCYDQEEEYLKRLQPIFVNAPLFGGREWTCPWHVANPFPISLAESIRETMDGAKAHNSVRENAGAFICTGNPGDPPRLDRDPIDQRIMRDEFARRKGDGHIRGTVADREWEVLGDGMPLKDGDGDGIPDTWETFLGLKSDDPSDNVATTIDSPYLNIEVYVNMLCDPIYSDHIKAKLNATRIKQTKGK